MNHFKSLSIAAVAIFLFASASFAQSTATPSGNGFWVIESNIKTPKNATVFFYNDNNDLIYKESVAGKKLKIKSEKVRNQLNEVLQQSLTIWNKEKVAKENQQWVVKRK